MCVELFFYSSPASSSASEIARPVGHALMGKPSARPTTFVMLICCTRITRHIDDFENWIMGYLNN